MGGTVGVVGSLGFCGALVGRPSRGRLTLRVSLAVSDAVGNCVLSRIVVLVGERLTVRVGPTAGVALAVSVSVGEGGVGEA
ncbi:MAG: hypothetical protein PVG71_15665 [Anaerolineae bacterium]